MHCPAHRCHRTADKVNYSRDIGGIHFLFVNIWPDSANRIWMEKDLKAVSTHVPVIIVAHDPPEGDAAHFTNPNGAHDINATGPGHDISLPVFRVDSPMKGKYSSKDETRLSFQLVTIDTGSRKMTVRECLWNADPAGGDTDLFWGESVTISL